MEATHPIITYPENTFGDLAMTKLPSDRLKWCRRNHYAIMAPPPKPMCLIEIWKLWPHHFYLSIGERFATEEFANKEKIPLGWSAIKTTPVSDSFCLRLSHQCKRLSRHERIPNVTELSWLTVVYHLVYRIRLFENVYVRTSSRAADGRSICFGYNDTEGISLVPYDDNSFSASLGLAAALKL